MSATGWRNMMWSEALDALRRIERVHRQAFAPERSLTGQMCWEPPADIIETDDEVLVFMALPGVDPERVLAQIEDNMLVVTGTRSLPQELRTAAIHRLELPQGRFQRRLPLPSGRYDSVRRSAVNGCVLIALRKAPDRRPRP
jgi:HSP20 family molecular chaperone IbpA